MSSILAPLADAARGRARLRQPLVWRLQQWISNYLPLALMALLAVFTTWLVRQAPSSEGPMVDRPARSTPDYQMRGFELQRFAAGGAARAWLNGDALRHFPGDDRIEIDGVRLRLVGEDGALLLAESASGVGPQSGEWLRLKGEVRVRRFAPGADPARDKPLLELRTQELLAERDGERLSSREATAMSTPRLQARVAGFRYTHGNGQFQFDGPSRFELPPAGKR
jgi:lipopolysaccharide export system protein LptC